MEHASTLFPCASCLLSICQSWSLEDWSYVCGLLDFGNTSRGADQRPLSYDKSTFIFGNDGTDSSYISDKDDRSEVSWIEYWQYNLLDIVLLCRAAHGNATLHIRLLGGTS